MVTQPLIQRGIKMDVSHYELATGIHLVTLNGPLRACPNNPVAGASPCVGGRHGDAVLRLFGQALNVSRAESVIRLFKDKSEQGIKRVVISLEDVPFIDSPGLVALTAGYKLFAGNPQGFRLAGLQDQPKLVFELTGYDRFLEILGSVSEASGVIDGKPGLQGSLLRRKGDFLTSVVPRQEKRYESVAYPSIRGDTSSDTAMSRSTIHVEMAQ
jgi:anti-anti-sigma factor